MALQDTNLFLESAPIPATWVGTPDNLREEIFKRVKIKSPAGLQFIYTGDSEPTSNIGPWLKGGTKWYVYDENIKRYVPVDVSDSVSDEIQISESTPASSSPPIWLRTLGGKPVELYYWDGALWTPSMSIVQSGTTAERPTSPFNLQQYYDTTISCLIWWERGQWRTVSGVLGDVKQVWTELLSDALTQNPGWELLGASAQSVRGRVLAQAAKDSQQTFTVDAGVAQRQSRETYGETDGISMDTHTHPASGPLDATGPAVASPVPYPPTLALWTLVKT